VRFAGPASTPSVRRKPEHGDPVAAPEAGEAGGRCDIRHEAAGNGDTGPQSSQMKELPSIHATHHPPHRISPEGTSLVQIGGHAAAEVSENFSSTAPQGRPAARTRREPYSPVLETQGRGLGLAGEAAADPKWKTPPPFGDGASSFRLVAGARYEPEKKPMAPAAPPANNPAISRAPPDSGHFTFSSCLLASDLTKAPAHGSRQGLCVQWRSAFVRDPTARRWISRASVVLQSPSPVTSQREPQAICPTAQRCISRASVVFTRPSPLASAHSQALPILWVANYNFSPENRRLSGLAPELIFINPLVGTASRAIRPSPRGGISNSPCAR